VARRVVATFAVLAGCFVGAATPGLAATQVSVDCSAGANLQSAINAAPHGAILDISGTCRGTFSVGKTLVLKGVSSGVLDAQGAGTTLTITGGNVQAFDLTITGGRSSEAGGVLIVNPGTFRLRRRVTVTGNVGGVAGGIVNRGTLVMARSLVANNGGPGILTEGIASIDTSTVSSNSGTGVRIGSGQAYIRDSTVDDNTSTSGAGGIQIDAGATIPVLARSTVADNASTTNSAGGIENTGSLTIIASTVAANESQAGTGGIHSSGNTSMTATILATNTHDGTVRFDCAGSIVSQGYNLLGTNAHPAGSPACSFSAVSTDLVGTSTPIDPMLGHLGKHGGSTRTIVPRAGSPAVDAIPLGAHDSTGGGAELCPAAGHAPIPDQRRVFRPQGPACDIGSVERAVTSSA
jgi:hypothetical protein